MNTSITAARNINTVTAEIRSIKEQTQRMILDSAVELGRRLCEAKEILAHGEWGSWLRDEADFSQSTANNLMRIFEEYGDVQGSLFGASAKSQTFGNLTYSKAIALLAVPSDEREDFIEDNDIENKSVRELEKIIKERNEALEAKKAAERMAEEQRYAMQDALDRAAEAATVAERIQGELETMRGELDELQNAGHDTALDLSALDEARKQAAAEAKREAEEKLKKKIDAAIEAKTKAEAARADAERDRDRIKQEREREQADMSGRIDKLEKQLAASGSQAVTAFKLHFETAQSALNKMLGCIGELESDAETRDKLSSALRAVCEKVLEKVT